MTLQLPDNSDVTDPFGRTSVDFPWLAFRQIHLGVRERDIDSGGEFLVRYLRGFQIVWESIFNEIEKLPLVNDFETTTPEALKHIAPGVGYVGRIARVLDGLTDDELRKAIGLAVPLWKRRFLDSGLIAMLRLFNGLPPAQISSFFRLRGLLDEHTFDFVGRPDDTILTDVASFSSISSTGNVIPTHATGDSRFQDLNADFEKFGVRGGVELIIFDEIRPLDNGRYLIKKLVDDNTIEIDGRIPSNGATGLAYYIISEKHGNTIEIAAPIGESTNRKKIAQLAELSRQVSQRIEIRYFDFVDNFEVDPTRLTVEVVATQGTTTFNEVTKTTDINIESTAGPPGIAWLAMIAEINPDGSDNFDRLKIGQSISIRGRFSIDVTPPPIAPYDAAIGILAIDYEAFWEGGGFGIDSASTYRVQLLQNASGPPGSFRHGVWPIAAFFVEPGGATTALSPFPPGFEVEIQEGVENTYQLDVIPQPALNRTILKLMVNGNLVATFKDAYRGAIEFGPQLQWIVDTDGDMFIKVNQLWSWAHPQAVDVVESSTPTRIQSIAAAQSHPIYGDAVTDDFSTYKAGALIGQARWSWPVAPNISTSPQFGVLSPIVMTAIVETGGQSLELSDGGRGLVSTDVVMALVPLKQSFVGSLNFKFQPRIRVDSTFSTPPNDVSIEFNLGGADDDLLNSPNFKSAIVWNGATWDLVISGPAVTGGPITVATLATLHDDAWRTFEFEWEPGVAVSFTLGAQVATASVATLPKFGHQSHLLIAARGVDQSVNDIFRIDNIISIP